jgi:hypothetical protein
MVDFEDQVDWDDMFESSMDAGMSQPVIAVPTELFEAERDLIVTAARRHGFMRVLFMKDAGSVHFCRYV